MKKIIVFIAFFLLAIANVFAQQACDPEQNLVLNGGFESPVVSNPPKNWNIYPNATPSLAWTVEWKSTQTSYLGNTRPEIPQLEFQAGFSGWLSAEGSQYAELDTDWDGPIDTFSGEPANVKIYQDLPTIPGQSYEVKFKTSPRPLTAITTNILKFSWNGAMQDTISTSGIGLSNTNWSQHTYQLTATSSTTRLKFVEQATPDSFGTFLDDVSVRCVPINEIPEFTTIGAGIALVGAGGYALYRKRK